MAITSAARETNASTDETKSQCRDLSGATLGATISVEMNARATTGTFTRNTDPHQKWDSRKPEMIGPSATPITEIEPQIAMAKLRSFSSVKLTRSRASVAGIIAAAPTARKARAAMRTLAVGANAATSEAMPNRTSPIRNIRRCPTRSPSVPAPRSNPAMTRG